MPTVLLVDDEPVLVRALVQYLSGVLPAGWLVLAEPDGEAALTMLQDDITRDIRVCIIDFHLRGISGAELIRRALPARPDLRGKLIVCSGSSFLESDPLFAELGCERLDKPFELEQLRLAVLRAIGHG